MRKPPPTSRMKTGTRTRGSPRAIVLEHGRLPSVTVSVAVVSVATGRGSPSWPFCLSSFLQSEIVTGALCIYIYKKVSFNSYAMPVCTPERQPRLPPPHCRTNRGAGRRSLPVSTFRHATIAPFPLFINPVPPPYNISQVSTSQVQKLIFFHTSSF